MNTEDVLIVSAQPEHASALTGITVAAKRHWNYPERWMELWLPLLTIMPEYIASHETWMVVIKKEPAGYYSFQQADEELWLDNLWILPAFMGRGLGRLLFHHALARARKRAAVILKIEADPNAEKFYEKLGARRIGERHHEIDGKLRILPVLEITL